MSRRFLISSFLLAVCTTITPAASDPPLEGLAVCPEDLLASETILEEASETTVAPVTAALTAGPDICAASRVTPAHIVLFEDTEGILLDPSSNFSDEVSLKTQAANALIAEHGDNFDFFGFWTNFEPTTQVGGANFMSMMGDFQGHGRSYFDNRPFWGLDGTRGRGFVTMYDFHLTANFDLNITLDHEFGHYWMVWLRPSAGRPFSQGAHAAVGADTQSGMHGINWVGPNNPVFRNSPDNTDTGVVWGWLPLYLMGYASAAEMDSGMSEQRYMDEVTEPVPMGAYLGPISTWSSVDLALANGPRVPTPDLSRKNWKVGWVLIHQPGNPPAPEELQTIADLVDGYCERWRTITLGRGTMTQSAFPDCDGGGVPGSGCPDCADAAECQDEVFCNGVETCNGLNGLCESVGDPCPAAGQVCFETEKRCVDCFSPRHCDDGLFCNGTEGCKTNIFTCTSGATPCLGSVCDEQNDRCVECLADSDCIAPDRCDPSTNTCVDPLRDCGDAVCGLFEDCEHCSSDCDGVSAGPPAGRFCCGNGVLEPAEGDGTVCDGNP